MGKTVNLIEKHRIWLAFAGCLFLASCNTSNSNKTENVLGSVAEPQQTASADDNSDIPDRRDDLRAFCPPTVIREGTEVFRTYEAGVKKTDPDAARSLRFQSTITRVARECNYTRTTLGMKVGVKGQVINGPTGATGSINVPIRVAIANPSTKQVVYSQLHQVQVSIDQGRTNAQFQFVDSQIDIPVPEKRDLVVFVGFDEGPPS